MGVSHAHGDDGADAGEGEGHYTDQRPIAQPDDAGHFHGRACSASSTVVLPVFTTCFGPRTECAGFVATTWPVTSQSNSMRMAARCCFTVGFSNVPSALDIGRDVQRLDVDKLAQVVVLAPGEEPAYRMQVGDARVLVADGGGKEFEEAARRMVAGIGDDCRHDDVGRDRA